VANDGCDRSFSTRAGRYVAGTRFSRIKAHGCVENFNGFSSARAVVAGEHMLDAHRRPCAHRSTVLTVTQLAGTHADCSAGWPVIKSQLFFANPTMSWLAAVQDRKQDRSGCVHAKRGAD